MILVCSECGYEWDYGGDAARATCPDCKHKVPVERTTLPDLDEDHDRLRHEHRKLMESLCSLESSFDELEAKVAKLSSLVDQLEEEVRRRND